jgi:hypothetical protein
MLQCEWKKEKLDHKKKKIKSCFSWPSPPLFAFDWATETDMPRKAFRIQTQPSCISLIEAIDWEAVSG